MTKRSPEKLLKLFETNEVVEFKEIQSALANAPRATCFRYLQQVPYHHSYNYNGRYYTRKDPTRYVHATPPIRLCARMNSLAWSNPTSVTLMI
jgi:hypothetical protein